MAQQTLNAGTTAGDGTGETLRSGMVKSNANFSELYQALSQVTSNAKTASYTLILSDAGTLIEMNVASANTLTVPPNSSVAFPVGTVIEVNQIGAGTTTITPGAGVTLRSPSSGALRAQWSGASIRKRATDEWVVSGDVA